MTIRLRPAFERVKPYFPALLTAALGLFLLIGQTHVALAVTPTPVPPTATIGLTIPTNTILSASNNWITTFAPIAAIGIGISIALAVLGYLGHMIVQAFRA